MTRTRTGFPFHLLTFAINIEKGSEAPDNFADDANCRKSDWQAGRRPDLLGRLID